MTVQNTTSVSIYTGNGVTTEFQYPGKITNTADVEVRFEDWTTLSSVLKTYGVDYNLSGVGSEAGGRVQFLTAPANGQTIRIQIRPSETQSTSIKNQGAFLPEIHEDALDKLTRLVQMLIRRHTRALRDDDLGPVISMLLPNRNVRANGMLGFDADGVPTIVSDIPTAFEIVTAAQSPFQAVAGKDYYVDVSTGAMTINLPASPTIQTRPISFVHLRGTITSNNLTIGRNGQLIMGLAEDMVVNTTNAAFQLGFSDAAGGWRLIRGV
jgi:hypothetical protein